MEITKREVIASITIIAVMMILGFVIAGKIDAYQIRKNSEYYKAIQITEPDQFRYCMDTSVGNAFIYGKLETVDPVTFPELGGAYLQVEIIEEHYTMHTRTVTTTDSQGNTHTRTEIYWTWDQVDSEEVHSQRIKFLDVEMDYQKIEIPLGDYIDTIKESSDIRFKYYGTPTECYGTAYTDLRNGAMEDHSKFYEEKDIEETLKEKTLSRTWLFWLIWIVLTGGMVWGFYYLDNSWLN